MLDIYVLGRCLVYLGMDPLGHMAHGLPATLVFMLCRSDCTFKGCHLGLGGTPPPPLRSQREQSRITSGSTIPDLSLLGEFFQSVLLVKKKHSLVFFRERWGSGAPRALPHCSWDPPTNWGTLFLGCLVFGTKAWFELDFLAWLGFF